jgi:hypothetical protein
MTASQPRPLLQRFNRVLSKRIGLALAVWGEPGVGKTHAVQALLRELPCRSASLHASVSDAELLRGLPRPERLPVWAEQIEARLMRGSSVEPAALEGALLARLAALAPFVLHIEDLHDASPTRTASVHALARAVIQTQGVALIVTSRTEPGAPFESHRWQPLEERAAVRLLEENAGATLPVEALTWIAAQARGNPLFTLGYFRHLTRSGHLWSDGQRWRWRKPEREDLPLSVEAVIAQHLNAVASAPAVRAALSARAMLPLSEVNASLWAAVAGLTPAALQSARTELERANVLRGDAFTHPLYREAARADLSQLARRDFARRAVDALIEDHPVAAAAFTVEAELPPTVEWTVLERGANQSRAAGDAGGTARLLARMADLEEIPARVERLLEAARLAREANLALALELAQTALQLSAPHLDARLLTAELLAALGRSDEAEAVLRDLPAHLDAAQMARGFETRVRVKHLSHDYAGVLKLWSERQTAQEQASAITQAMIARAMVQINQLEDAEALLARALSAPKLSHLELAELLYIRAFVPNFAGQYALAEVGFSAFLHTLDAMGESTTRFREMRAGALQLRAYMRNVLGRPAEAAADLREALHFHAEIGDASHYAQLQSELGLYLMESGEPGAAEDALQEARAVLERVDNPIYLSMLERIEARLHLEAGAPHGAALALKHARASLHQIERAGRPDAFTAGALFVNAWAEAKHGRAEEALRWADELERLSAQPSNRAGAAWVRGLAFERLSNTAEALRSLRSATEIAAPMRLGPSLERMALELDRLEGNAQGARDRARHFQDLGAINAARVAERYFPGSHGSAETPGAAQRELRLEVLGETRIGRTALSPMAREFLMTLLEARLEGRAGRSNLELFDALYPGWPDDKSARALKQLVYRLRSALGSGAILRTGNGYALGAAVVSDAETFLESGDTALWRGPYRADLGVDATSSGASALYAALRARIFALENADEVARAGVILLEAQPFDREIFGFILRALKAHGQRTAAARLYNRVRSAYEDVGERLPDDWEAFEAADKQSVQR